MRACLIGGRRAASVIAILGAAALTGCSSGGKSATGTAGATGSSGAGSAGTAGTAGATGSAGTMGPAGATGASGATGTAGTTGTAGATGTAGTTGTAGATGAGGATGTAGADGGATTSDGGASALTLPVLRDGLYTLEFGNTKFTVDPMPGGRTVEFSLDGTNILTNTTANASYWGSTFWTAPESKWMGSSDAKAGANMMLVAAFDTLPFTMTLAANNSFSAVGPNTTFANMTLNVSKQYAANLTDGTVDITYSITNQGTNTFTTGHWEVTRVYPGGLTFFPAPPAASAPPIIANPSVMKVDKMGAYLWFDHSKFNPGPPPGTYGKYSTDASGGWVAHVIPDAASGKGDILLIKTFKDIPDGTAGAGHGEVEIYCSPDGKYEEIEDHHEQAMFTAGQTIPWPVRWYLRRLPITIARTEGNQALVDFVTATLPK